MEPSMERDVLRFPKDDTGELLWAMYQSGDALDAPRDVNFSLLFESETDAESYAVEMRDAAFEVQVDEFWTDDGASAWEAVVTAHFAPTYERVIALTELFESMARDHSGFENGWASAEPRR